MPDKRIPRYIRLPPETNKKLNASAEKKGISGNMHAVSLICEGLEKELERKRVALSWNEMVKK